jgi:hypothetical protein
MKYVLSLLVILLLTSTPVRAALSSLNSTFLTILSNYLTNDSQSDLIADSKVNIMDASYVIQTGGATPTAQQAMQNNFPL